MSIIALTRVEPKYIRFKKPKINELLSLSICISCKYNIIIVIDRKKTDLTHYVNIELVWFGTSVEY